MEQLNATINNIYNRYDEFCTRIELKLITSRLTHKVNFKTKYLEAQIMQARRFLIYYCKVSGMTDIEISKCVGISCPRVYQIVHKADRELGYPKYLNLKGEETKLVNSYREKRGTLPNISDDILKEGLIRIEAYGDAFNSLMSKRRIK